MVKEIILIINRHDSTVEERTEIVSAVLEIDNLDSLRIIQVDNHYFDSLVNVIQEEYA